MSRKHWSPNMMGHGSLIDPAPAAAPSVPSQVRVNAKKDPTYRPYCMRCPGLVRMQIVEPMLWSCKCGAVHDERSTAPSVPRNEPQDVEYTFESQLKWAMGEVSRLTRELSEAREERDQWVEREAAVCPEDFSFEEVIASLKSQLSDAREVIEAARTVIDGYSSKQNRSRAGTIANLRDRLASYDSRRVSDRDTP